MCLILLAIEQHPDYPLIILANRDEYYARKSTPLHWWADNQNLLGGQDLESGGSWMAITRQGRFSAVTNYREAGSNQPRRPSRGFLVSRYLQESRPDWTDWLNTHCQNFNGFNLLFGEWNRLTWFSNRNQTSSLLIPGIYGLCNGLLDTPWPKVTRGKHRLQQKIKQNAIDPESLLQILTDDQPATTDELPATGISQEWEKVLSAIFIHSPTYGTRSSTILKINRQQHAQITERSWLAKGRHSDRYEQFDICP